MDLSCEVTGRLRCPHCRRGPLSVEPEALACACGRSFPVVDGIPSMGADSPAPEPPGPDLTVLILAYNEGENLSANLATLATELADLGTSWEILVVDGNSKDDTAERARAGGARVHVQREPGYGNAFREGLELCRGRWVATLDADLSHDPGFLRTLWARRHQAEVVVGSRYMAGAETELSLFRLYLSRFTNAVFRTLLEIPVRDLTSGYRLYLTAAARAVPLQGNHFEILLELLAELYDRGHSVVEVPMYFKPRGVAASKLRVVSFGQAYHRLLLRLLARRRSPGSADLDHRLYHRFGPEGSFRRRAHRQVKAFLEGRTRDVLVVQCDSGQLVQSLPAAVGVDSRLPPLRYLRTTNTRLVQAEPTALPFGDGAFQMAVLHPPLEDLAEPAAALTECRRVASGVVASGRTARTRSLAPPGTEFVDLGEGGWVGRA